MYKSALLMILVCLTAWRINAQEKIKSFPELKNSIQSEAFGKNSYSSSGILSDKARNLFMQRKLSYLSGSSDLSLSKAYSTYVSEDDKLTFGFTFRLNKKDEGELVSIFNPFVETDIKENFATLFKKGEWQSNIRAGVKFTWFPKLSFAKGIAFSEGEEGLIQKNRLIEKRAVAAMSILENINRQEAAYNQANARLSLEFRDQKQNLKQENEPEYQTQIDAGIKQLEANENYQFDRKLKEYQYELAKAEVEALYDKDAYKRSDKVWVSFLFFYPVTERRNYIAADKTQAFAEQPFNPWELNVQGNYFHEWAKLRFLSILNIAPSFKVFQNNTAMADLMTAVDYHQYVQFPGVDTLNAAILDKNDAFIGNYREFVTSNFNLKVVLTASDKKRDGGEKFLVPGISIRFEKNFGDYSAMNWRFGLPVRFKGKDAENAVNIEPQVRLNNTNNYAHKADYKVRPIIGVNLGLPFVAMFKE